MASEYEPTMDADKTLPILPRPVHTAQEIIRALNLTGDPTGYSPTDNHATWLGTDQQRLLAIERQINAEEARTEAIHRTLGAI